MLCDLALQNRDGDQLIEDRGGLVEDNEKLDELREDSVVNIPGLTSPRRRPSLMEDDLPADDDVLATLLGAFVYVCECHPESWSRHAS